MRSRYIPGQEKPGGTWNQQRLSRVATITNFNMASEGSFICRLDLESLAIFRQIESPLL